MDKKVMIIAAVAVVAVVAIAAVAVVMMNNNNSEKDYNAKELAEKFVEKYDGQFGEFKIQDGANESVAKMISTVDTYARDGTKLSKTRDQYLDVYHYDTVDEAKAAFNKFLTESKNGSGGETLLTKTDAIGMASQSLKLIDLRENSAGDYGADHAYFLYASSFTTTSSKYSTTTAFSQVAGAFIDGKNVIVFNTSTNSLYLNKTIDDSPITGERAVSVDVFESELVKLCKAF